MDIFVSGQLAEIGRVRKLYQRLNRLGLQITHDWTRTDNLTGGYSQNRSEAGRRAKLDIDGVVSCDTYIILTDNSKCGKGMYVELGAALAQAEIRPEYQVLLVGPMNHESIFYYHPSIRHFDSDEGLLSFLQEKSARTVAA